MEAVPITKGTYFFSAETRMKNQVYIFTFSNTSEWVIPLEMAGFVSIVGAKLPTWLSSEASLEVQLSKLLINF